MNATDFLNLARSIINYSNNKDYVNLGHSLIDLTRHYYNLDNTLIKIIRDKKLNWKDLIFLGDFFSLLEKKYCRKDGVSDSSLRDYMIKCYSRAYILCPRKESYFFLIKTYRFIEQNSSFKKISENFTEYDNTFISDYDFCVDNNLYYNWNFNTRALRYARLLQLYLYKHINIFKSFYDNINFQIDDNTILKYRRNIIPASDKEIKNASNIFFKNLLDEVSNEKISEDTEYEEFWGYDIDNNYIFLIDYLHDDYDYENNINHRIDNDY